MNTGSFVASRFYVAMQKKLLLKPLGIAAGFATRMRSRSNRIARFRLLFYRLLAALAFGSEWSDDLIRLETKFSEAKTL